MRKYRSLAVLLVLVLLLTPILASCGVSPEDDRTVLTVDGKEVKFDEYNYVYQTTIDDYSEDADPEKLKNEVLEILKNMYAVYGLAEKYGVELTGDEKDSVKEYIKNYKDSYESEEKYLEYLQKSHLTEWSFKRALELNKLWEKLYNHLTNEASGIILADDETVIKDTETNFYRATYIFINLGTGEKIEENKSLAEALADRAASGEEFFALVDEYSEDKTMANNPDGRYFTSGELLEFFEEAVKNLEIGAVSGVVSDISGYYIIKRLPVERDYVLDNLSDIRESYTARLCNEIVEEYRDSIQVSFTELYHSITPIAE